MLLFTRALLISLLLALSELVSGVPTLEYMFAKGDKGSRGYPGIVGESTKGAKGDAGIPGVCSTTVTSCSSLVDLRICSEITLFLRTQIVDNNDESDTDTDSDDDDPIGDDSAVTLVNKLRQGVFTVNQLNQRDARNILKFFCVGSIETFEKGQKGDKGESGVGLPGKAGAPGRNGLNGHKGIKGDSGVPKKGEKGEKGCIGDMGPVGNTGLPGSTGPAGAPGRGGMTFIHWGENFCPPSSQLLLKGLAFNFRSKHDDLLCIHTLSKPSVTIGTGSVTHQLTLVAYFSVYYSLHYLTCAQCHAPNKTAVFVQLGAEVCPSGWTTEYSGYAVSTQTSDVVCLQDRVAKRINWKNSPSDLKLINISCPYSVAICSGYLSTDSLACALCTK